MRSQLKIFLLVFALAVAAVAQTPTEEPKYWIAAGAGVNYLAPQAYGWMSFGARVAEGTYSYTSMDMTDKNASMRTGILRLIIKQDRFALLAIADGGVAAGGGQFTAAVSSGGVFAYDISPWTKVAGTYVMVSVRVQKNGLADIQPVFGVGVSKTF